MKLLKRMLVGLGVAAAISHSVYLSARVHDLESRLRETDQRIGKSASGILQMNAATMTPTFETQPIRPPIEERLRALEEDLHPRIRLLGETAP